MFAPPTVPPTPPRTQAHSVDVDELEALRRENAQLKAEAAEHARLRESLVQQEATLRTVLETIPQFVFWKDLDSVYLGCNENIAKLAGFSRPADLIGKTDYDMPWTREEADYYRQCDREVMAAGKPQIDIEESLVDGTGRTNWILTSKVPLRDDKGAVIGILGIFTDITSRKNMELELKKAKDAAEAASNAKGDFLAAVSHELRTPLALILGPLDTLCDDESLPAKARGELERVRRNARRLKQEVDDILDLAKADAGKAVVCPESVDLTELVTSIVDEARPAAATRQLELSVDADTIEPLWLDRRMVDKIVLNLIGNALKFTPAGGRVDVALRATNDGVAISVRDSGIGIGERDQALLFNRFQQVDASSKRSYGGTGLGLALAKEFTDLMGGSIRVESALGQGSTFTVTLPRRAATTGVQCVCDDVPAKASAAHARFDKEWGGANPRPDAAPEPSCAKGDPRRARVVLAEDNTDLRAYLVSLLGEWYEVVACANGAEALRAVQASAPDVVVSDVMMPEMDGNELVARMKGDATLAAVPILLLTAQAGRDGVVNALGRGADDFVAKPFNPAELVARVSVAVRLSRAHRELVDKNRELYLARDMLVESEKLSALGRLLTQLSHEINNPMTVILGSIDPMQEYLSAMATMLAAYRARPMCKDPELESLRDNLEIDFVREDFASTLGSVREAVQRVINIQHDLRSFLRGDPVVKEASDMNDALRLTLNMVRRGLASEVVIEEKLDELPTVSFNTGQMKQVFLNLLQNAVQAVKPAGGHVVVTTECDGDVVRVVVQDDGPGVAPEIRSRIFEPFFTTKDVGAGSGLGLAVSRQIVAEHGGTLRLDESTARGARFVLEVPCRAERATA